MRLHVAGSLSVMCALLCVGTVRANEDEIAVAAYLPEWRYEGANWDEITKRSSHLILFSLEVPEGSALVPVHAVHSLTASPVATLTHSLTHSLPHSLTHHMLNHALQLQSASHSPHLLTASIYTRCSP